MGCTSLRRLLQLGLLIATALGVPRETRIGKGFINNNPVPENHPIDLAQMHKVYIADPNEILLSLDFTLEERRITGYGDYGTSMCICYETHSLDHVGDKEMCHGMGSICYKSGARGFVLCPEDLKRENLIDPKTRRGFHMGVEISMQRRAQAQFLLNNVDQTYRLRSYREKSIFGHFSTTRKFAPFVVRHDAFERKWYVMAAAYASNAVFKRDADVQNVYFHNSTSYLDPIIRREPVGIEKELKSPPPKPTEVSSTTTIPQTTKNTTVPPPTTTLPKPVPKSVVASALRLCILVSIVASFLVAALTLLRIIFGDCLCGTLLWRRRRRMIQESKTTTTTAEQVIFDDRRKKRISGKNVDEKRSHEMIDVTQQSDTNTNVAWNEESSNEESTNPTSAAPASDVTSGKGVKGPIFTRDENGEGIVGGAKIGDDDHLYEDASLQSGSEAKNSARKRSRSKRKNPSNRLTGKRKYGVHKQETRNLSLQNQERDAQLDGTQEPTNSKDRKALKTGVHKVSMTTDKDDKLHPVTGVEDGQKHTKTDLKTGLATGTTQELTKARTHRTSRTQHEPTDNVEETQNGRTTKTRGTKTDRTQQPSDQEGDEGELNATQAKTRTGGTSRTQVTKTRRSTGSNATQNRTRTEDKMAATQRMSTKTPTRGASATQGQSAADGDGDPVKSKKPARKTQDKKTEELVTQNPSRTVRTRSRSPFITQETPRGSVGTSRTQVTKTRRSTGSNATQNPTRTEDKTAATPTRVVSATQGQSSAADGDGDPVESKKPVRKTQDKKTEATHELVTQKPTRTVRTRSRSPFVTQETSRGSVDKE